MRRLVRYGQVQAGLNAFRRTVGGPPDRVQVHAIGSASVHAVVRGGKRLVAAPDYGPVTRMRGISQDDFRYQTLPASTIIRLNLMSATAKQTAPIPATIRNSGQTASMPAPR